MKAFLLGFIVLLLADDVRAQTLSGTLIVTGSDTLAELVTSWGDQFSSIHPGVRLEVQATGSGSAPPALAAGTANIGTMSRLMSADELSLFERARGFRPSAFPVAVDAVALITHPTNPLSAIDIAALDGIFSQTGSCGGGALVRRWSDLGVIGDEWQRVIEPYGRTSVSGTHAFFRQRALCGGDFYARVNQLPGSSAIVDAVRQQPTAIGYTAAGFASSDVNIVGLQTESGVVFPNTADVLSGAYPLARVLYFYLPGDESQRLGELTCEFIRFTQSEQGQVILNASGFIAVPEGLTRSISEATRGCL